MTKQTLSLHSLKEEDNSLCWWTPLSPVSGRRRLKVKLVAECAGCWWLLCRCVQVHRHSGAQVRNIKVTECNQSVIRGGCSVTTSERQELKGRWQVVDGLMPALVSWEATSEGGLTGTI